MSLSPARLERFARHIVLPEIGGAGLSTRHTLCCYNLGAGSLFFQSRVLAC